MALLDVKIPPMGESITTGILAKWHVQDGAIVKKDQPLFELETDKITSEGLAEIGGKISLKVSVGADVKIGQSIATIDTSVVAEVAAPALGATSPIAKVSSENSPAVGLLVLHRQQLATLLHNAYTL